MKNKLYFILILVVTFMALLSVPVANFAIHEMDGARMYVTGRYGKYCYLRQNANGNIKYFVYYKSLENCGKPLHQ